MGFYIRKSFRAGPIRLNLSKGGLGASVGVKGARVGITSRGRSYVHAGRGGLYFRQYGSSRSRQAAQGNNVGCIVVVLLGLGLWLATEIFDIFIKNPWAIVAVVLAISVVCGYYLWKRYNEQGKEKAIKIYKDNLTKCFDFKGTNDDLISYIKTAEQQLGIDGSDQRKRTADEEIYSHILGQILDDDIIDQEEQSALLVLESRLSVSNYYVQQQKKEFFDMYCLRIVADHEVTDREAETIMSLIDSFDLQQGDMQESLAMVEEFLEAQSYASDPEEQHDIGVNIQKSETAYFVGTGRVIKQRKLRSSEKSGTQEAKREGKLVVTQKRLIIANKGLTSISFKDMIDIELDLEKRQLFITKKGVQRRTIVESPEIVVVFKMLQKFYQE